MEIIDIDKSDKYKEYGSHRRAPAMIMKISSTGMMGKNSSYRKSICIHATIISGNGFVYTSYWAGFYIRTEKYQYDPSSRSFTRIPQYAYYVGIKVNVLKPFTIYADEVLKQKVALLSKDSEIDIILERCTDALSGNILLIRSQTGLIGWVKEEGITEFLQLPCAG
jgi:hypothetical protein